MPSVLLTHSNHIYSDPKQAQKMQPYPPLQTILAAAAQRANGIAAHLFDPTFDDSPRAFRHAVDRLQPDLIAVCEDDFNFLSKMCLAANRQRARQIAAIAAECGVPAIAHGADATDRAAEYLAFGFAAVLLGEVEQTLVEYAQGRPRDQIAGLFWRSHDSLRRNPPRAPITDLDSLPPPAWDLVDIGQYRSAWTSAHGYFSLNLASSRGCPYRCNWCAKPVYGSRYRVRSPRAVAAEMHHVKSVYRPDHIWFADDIFALATPWAEAFASQVRSLRASLPFKMQSRCDLMARPAAVAALRAAGCEEVWMGVESGSPRVLDRMEKNLAIEDVYAARENLRRHGIRACFFLQFGYPGEDWSDIEATIRLVRETSPDDIGVSVSYPLPGTKFHQIVSGQMGAKANWETSGDLSMIFHGAFSTAFYRALADALHIEVRGGGNPAEAWRKVESLRSAAASEAVA